MSELCSLNLEPILSTGGMRSLDADSKDFLAKTFKNNPSEQDVVLCGYTLMKEAGLALFTHVNKLVKSKALEPVVIFVGSGNNGGDGLVLAKLLLQARIKSTVFSLATTDKFKNEAKLALEDFLKAGGTFASCSDLIEKFKQGTHDSLANFKLVVDCMLGNGAKGELRPEFATVVQIINESGLPVISADAPTGYDSAAHFSNEICIHANETMLFGFPRLDAYVKEGGNAFGKAVIAQLSYPAEIVQKSDEKNYLVTEDAIPQLLPKRDEWGDKRNQGSTFIIAGSKDMPGAAALCTEAALRSGAGLVTLATTEAITPIIQAKLSEPVFCSLSEATNNSGDGTAECSATDTGERCGNSDIGEGLGNNNTVERRGVLQPQHIKTILKKAKYANAVAIGPGLTTDASTVQAILKLLPQIKASTVIDADALNAIATLNENATTSDAATGNCTAISDCAAVQYLHQMQSQAILTPHVREFARLFGELPKSSFDIPNCLRKIAASTNKVILLKGAPTYIASPDGNVYIIPVANSGMAKGGSGDVLTGIIAALLSQGLATTEAAVLGALLHQKAGRITREELGAFSMLPSDIIKNLHKAFECKQHSHM